jgi:hypothetical protein
MLEFIELENDITNAKNRGDNEDFLDSSEERRSKLKAFGGCQIYV